MCPDTEAKTRQMNEKIGEHAVSNMAGTSLDIFVQVLFKFELNPSKNEKVMTIIPKV